MLSSVICAPVRCGWSPEKGGRNGDGLRKLQGWVVSRMPTGLGRRAERPALLNSCVGTQGGRAETGCVSADELAVGP